MKFFLFYLIVIFIWGIYRQNRQPLSRGKLMGIALVVCLGYFFLNFI
jgi:hypothetical protein